ncbi:MAG: hypothetical protein PHW52_04345 [Candidatus Pacebacteria bacterium]|nr:hypothetical protein [Candidatus Paceibacterota bacterium]
MVSLDSGPFKDQLIKMVLFLSTENSGVHNGLEAILSETIAIITAKIDYNCNEFSFSKDGSGEEFTDLKAFLTGAILQTSDHEILRGYQKVVSSELQRVLKIEKKLNSIDRLRELLIIK